MKLKYPLHVMKIGDTWGAVPVGTGERRFNGYLRMDYFNIERMLPV